MQTVSRPRSFPIGLVTLTASIQPCGGQPLFPPPFLKKSESKECCHRRVRSGISFVGLGVFSPNSGRLFQVAELEPGKEGPDFEIFRGGRLYPFPHGWAEALETTF
jgi:hypothetical protein